VRVTAVILLGSGGLGLRLLVRALHLAVPAFHLLAALLAVVLALVVLALVVLAVIHRLMLRVVTRVRIDGWGGLACDGRRNDKREGAKDHLHFEISDAEV
jgi:hypothetical protein